jgi:hypothetical protein
MVAPTVAVVGMSALRRDMARLTGDAGPLNKALSAAGRVAAEPVRDITRSRLPQVTGRLADDVRITATRSGAAVRMGRASIRYAGWVEFGGTRRVPHRSTREYLPRGRYLFPAALELADTAAGLYAAGVTKALDAFGWTNAGGTPDSVHD